MDFLKQWPSNINVQIQICEKNKVLDVDKIKSIRKKEYMVKNTACLNNSNYCVLNVQMLAMLSMFLIHKGTFKINHFLKITEEKKLLRMF